eukprot:COSAG06_NODE_15124_length_1096_cov_1.026078_1_plen_110_part_00
MIRCDLATDWAFADKNAPLYAHMETMERLPIPEVEPTLEMYLHSVRPYLTEEEFEVSKVSASHMPVARCDVETAAPRDPSLTLTRWRPSPAPVTGPTASAKNPHGNRRV